VKSEVGPAMKPAAENATKDKPATEGMAASSTTR
jgi:hypothetical protein